MVFHPENTIKELDTVYKPFESNILNEVKFDKLELNQMIQMFGDANLDIEDLSFKKINKMHNNFKELIKKQVIEYLKSQNLFTKTTVKCEKLSSKNVNKNDS